MIARHNALRTWMICTWILGLTAIAATAQSGTAGLLSVQSDERSGSYALGEEVVFTITPQGNGASGDLSKVVVAVIRDGWEKLTTPKVKRSSGMLEVRFTPPAAGWYMCEAAPSEDSKVAFRAGVLVDPDKIAPSVPAPDDLDDFWDLRRVELAAKTLKTEIAPVEVSEPEIECFSIELECPKGNPVRGYFAQPKNTALKNTPAILQLRAAGVSGDWCKASPQHATWLAKHYKAIAVDINAHGMLNGQPAEYYRKLEEGELRNYWAQGNDNKDEFYFVQMYIRLLRAIDFIAGRDNWDGKHLVAVGESQGGGQALAAGALDQRVSAVVAVVPAMCDFTGPLAHRAGGWPQPLGGNIESPEARKIAEAVRYCDNLHLAKWSHAETVIFAGLADTTCPPCGIIATYNNLPGMKWIINYPHKPHNGLPEDDMWIGEISMQQDLFIKGHFEK
ncbi:MAG: acetylxylan esterase [Solirubrobacterales bacterium]